MADLVAEPSDDDIAAPDIKATAKSSTEGATPAFLHSVELRQDQVEDDLPARTSIQPLPAAGSGQRVLSVAEL